jgi:hypothetical protein
MIACCEARCRFPQHCFHLLSKSFATNRYHHTEADTFDKIDPAHLTQNLQCVLALAFALV